MRLSARWAPTALLLLVPLISGAGVSSQAGMSGDVRSNGDADLGGDLGGDLSGDLVRDLGGDVRRSGDAGLDGDGGLGGDLGSAGATAGARQVPVPVERSVSAIPGQYIVTLKPAFSAATVVRQLGVKPLFTYGTALRGFAAALTGDQLRAVRAFPAVQAIEENARISVGSPSAERARSVEKPVGRAVGKAVGTAVKAESWGLDRIDQRKLPLDNDFTVTGTGSGVTAYIVDTGVETAHSEFGGRATVGFDAIGDGRNGQDCNGHGTHVAGTTGGATYGVARSASLVAVRVLNCQGKGDWAGVIAGFDWVAANARQPAVLNASIGGSSSTAVDSAVDAVTATGVLPVVAAGNESQDACGVSPAGATSALAVGATDNQDGEARFSNYGRCLTTYAPGVAIVSAKLGGGSSTLNGTSMASPHVAGVAALLKAKYPTASPAELTGWLTKTSTKDVVRPISTGSPNRLLYTGGL
ncbi:S8 family peptidase [Streptomyces sp. NBC_00872]|uniref:S8 family peptidase n=1 Tax=Streptomyces sp. NBC_00872 TaxID=2903686 RepID=UPI0038697051|nr:S8 family peptidase [Streptomyces sp. NBC_00872]